MAKCDVCKAPARYVARKRFNLLPIKQRYLCDLHKKKFERGEDVFVLLALIISVAFLVFSVIHDQQAKRIVAVQQQIEKQKLYEELDLDRDGRVSLFEAQATDKQIANFNTFGYPFFDVLEPHEPTKSVKKRIALNDFRKWLQENTPADVTMISYFPHPKLMQSFLDQHTQQSSDPFLNGIYLTHDGYLAFVLSYKNGDKNPNICLERLDQELFNFLAAHP